MLKIIPVWKLTGTQADRVAVPLDLKGKSDQAIDFMTLTSIE
jgi:hypothetical protein